MRLARNLVNGRVRPLPQSSISRALNDLQSAEFFSVGMRKRNRLGRVESYRMIAGPSADRAIQESDGRLFDRGHCFGTAIDRGEEITIGVSTSSKVWSNNYDQIPALLAWCDGIAAKIASGRTVATGSRLDLLSTGEELQTIPDDVIAMSWNPDVYQDPPFISYRRPDGLPVHRSVLDFNLDIIACDNGEVTFSIRNEEVEWRGVFSLGGPDLFRAASEAEPEFFVHVEDEDRLVCS
jgi:hypothetical protein